MAAGSARRLGGDRVVRVRGRNEPADEVKQVAVTVMAEVGVNISGEAVEIVRAADVVVTMGCGDACPVYPGKRYVARESDEPSGKTVEEVKPIRDELERRVCGLADELLPTPTAT